MPQAFIRADEFQRRLGVRRTKFEQMVAGRELPQPIRIGGVRVFIEAEVEDALNNILAAARGTNLTENTQ